MGYRGVMGGDFVAPQKLTQKSHIPFVVSSQKNGDTGAQETMS